MALTTADLAQHLDMAVPTGGALTEFSRFLSAAVQGVTRMTGWLDATSGTAYVSTMYEPVLRLPYARLVSVDSILDPTGAVVVPLWVDLVAGLVTVPVGARGTWTVTCTGRAWPAELAVAALDWAAHLYETQRVVATAEPDEDGLPASPAYALPNRVTELITPYRLPGAA